jgi:hypothetical protein
MFCSEPQNVEYEYLYSYSVQTLAVLASVKPDENWTIFSVRWKIKIQCNVYVTDSLVDDSSRWLDVCHLEVTRLSLHLLD